MYECKQCKQKLNKYMHEIQKMSYTPKKRLPQSLCCASPFFILLFFLFLIIVPVAFVIAATGSSVATSDFRIK